MKIISLIFNFSIKDWLILITLSILFFCILEIRKLKKKVAQQVQNRLIPQLLLEFILDLDTQNSGFHLKNESFFLAQDIRIEDIPINLDDYGFRLGIILRFKNIDFLKAKESVKLDFKVLDKKQEPLAEVTERILPHLLSPSFKAKVYYSNIEGLKFCAIFNKKREKFYTDAIESCA